MIRRGIALAAIGIGVLLLAGLPLLMHQGGLDPFRRLAIQLRELATFEAELDRAMLRARSDRDLHWDAVVSASSSIEQMQREIAPHVAALAPLGDSPLGVWFDAHLEASDDRMELVERFKTEHALLRNSMRYLPTAADSLVNVSTGDVEADRDRALLTIRVTKALFGGSEENPSALVAELESIGSDHGGRGSARLTSFVEHARRSLVTRERVDELLGAILDHPSDRTFTELRSVFEARHSGALRRAERAQAVLGVVALALVGVVGFVTFRLRQSASNLRNLNATLEVRVQSRTNELEKEVEQRRSAEERARALAYFDNLTGLPNRRLFRDRLEQVLAERRRDGGKAAVLFLDLDGFKQINDVYGHELGDSLLSEVSRRLEACIRASDSISRPNADSGPEPVVARQGGDEFIVLAGRVRASEDASVIACRLIAAVAEPFRLDTHEVRVGLSVGISVYPEDAKEPDALLRNADLALYEVKARGRGSYSFFCPTMHERVAERARVETELRRGLSEDGLFLHYQPKVSVSAGGVESVEALLRWQHPERGLLLPGAFLHVAEQSGLIDDIARWTLECACRQGRQWLVAGHPLRIAVDIPPRLVRPSSLGAYASSALDASGLPADLLEIEITENCMLENEEEAAICLSALRERGVRVSLDAFGTGYSSISYLRALPLDWVKLDRSLTERLDDMIGVVRAVVDLAHSSGLRVVAEGVEDRAHARHLLAMDCDAMQGGYFAPPGPLSDLDAAIEHASARLAEIRGGRGRAA